MLAIAYLPVVTQSPIKRQAATIQTSTSNYIMYPISHTQNKFIATRLRSIYHWGMNYGKFTPEDATIDSHRYKYFKILADDTNQ